MVARPKPKDIANMSHEIRTLLHGITCAVDLLAGTILDSQQRYFLKVIIWRSLLQNLPLKLHCPRFFLSESPEHSDQ